ncbi:MAG: ABC transporter ATP-binding protein [Candidatus Eremiobacteraeota bacterium]|nr:ABC transporter ATP-binding protein [Candidatus Eremiobacteraeota bacterium]
MSAVRCRGLRKTFGSTVALDGLDLEVPEGELFGLVGPDGAGKTTLLKTLAGLLSYEGELSVVGNREEIGYIPQRFSLYTDLSIQENVNFFSALYPRSDEPARLLEFVGLERFRERLAGQLSGGMKQKLALVCALIHKPSLLLMDEPTVGVDPVSRREFWALVFQLQSEGLTVVASTPYMDEAEQFDRVALIDRGRFLRLGSTDEIKASVDGEVVEVFCRDPVAARERLLKAGHVEDAELFGDRLHAFVPRADQATLETVRRSLEGLEVWEVEPAEYSVEDVFLRLTEAARG